MRLINTETLELHEFFESQAPSYAILSHTWEKDEITFQEMVSKSPSTVAKAGYKKIQDTCRMARRRGKPWVWVDTCCIDKSSSAELTESINSMYRWYQNAEECYAYLVDFAPGSLPREGLEKCRWFTRGFTLQELIAPKIVLLFDRDWNVLGEKSDNDILEIINRITRVSKHVLLHRRSLSDFAIAERMLWASTRQTTRPEDKAYCLLGIFEVNMPLIYGEGDNAFRRLQEEIIKRSNDLSIFAWGVPVNFQSTKNEKSLTEHASCNLFATSPADFGAAWEHMEEGTTHLRFFDRRSIDNFPEFTLTNKGLNMNGNIRPTGIFKRLAKRKERHLGVFYTIYHQKVDTRVILVLLEKVGPGLYVRLGVRILMNGESYWTEVESNPYAISSITNTILMDHGLLSKSERYLFEGTVSIKASPDLRISVPYALPHTHWDASRLLFFPPQDGVYGQSYEIACVHLNLHVTHSKFDQGKRSTRKLYVIIDFRHTLEGEIPRAFVLGKDDLPEITSLIQQSHIPHHVLFPGHGPRSTHLLDKGPGYGLQKVVTLGSAHKPETVTIRIESAWTQPPIEFTSVLGRSRPRTQCTVRLHATVEAD